ncbi:uncharacterized protein LOC144441888 [Glandiceps talaboti]
MNQILKTLVPVFRQTQSQLIKGRLLGNHKHLNRVLIRCASSESGNNNGLTDDESMHVRAELTLKFRQEDDSYVLKIKPEGKSLIPALPIDPCTEDICWSLLEESPVQIWSHLSRRKDGFLRMTEAEKNDGEDKKFDIDTRGDMGENSVLWKLMLIRRRSFHPSAQSKDEPSHPPKDGQRFNICMPGINISDEYKDSVFYLRVVNNQMQIKEFDHKDAEEKNIPEYIFRVVYHYSKDAFTIVHEQGDKLHYISSNGRGEVSLVQIPLRCEELPRGFRNPAILFSFETSNMYPIHPTNVWVVDSEPEAI